MDETKLPMYNPANPQFSIDFILSKARGSLLASGLNNHAFNTAMTGMVLNFHHIIDRVLILPFCDLISVSWIKKRLKMEILNRIKAQLSLAAAAQRQINQRNAAMISQKANLLRNFQMESNKAQSKFLHYNTFTTDFERFFCLHIKILSFENHRKWYQTRNVFFERPIQKRTLIL